MQPIIINITGKAEHGKTTTRNMLYDELTLQGKRCLKVSYGSLVKYIATTYFGWNGEKDEAGRTLLQWLGTDKIRKVFPTFWVNHIIDIVTVFEEDYDFVLVDDCRFDDEVTTWTSTGYNTLVVRVNRLGYESNLTEEQKKHPSEAAIDYELINFDIETDNLYGLEVEAKSLAKLLLMFK